MTSNVKMEPETEVQHSKRNIPKILTSGIAGIAGGIAIGSMLPLGIVGFLVAGLAAGGVTGYAEYIRGKVNNSDDVSSNKDDKKDEEVTENYM
jgi:hypothetical protein